MNETGNNDSDMIDWDAHFKMHLFTNDEIVTVHILPEYVHKILTAENDATKGVMRQNRSIDCFFCFFLNFFVLNVEKEKTQK